MKTIRLKLKPLGSYLTDWSSDTITGALLWAYNRRFGSIALGQLISSFLKNEPPFVLSSGFPGDLLPRPFLPQPARQITTLTQIEEGKKLKKSQWVTLDEFNNLRQGQPAKPEEIPRSMLTEVVMHNQVSRISGSTSEGGKLYTVEEHFLDIKHFQHISVYAYVQPEWAGLLAEMFSDLGRTGIGARSSTGKGAFIVEENDNGAIDLVSKKWANIADRCNCAVELVHHVRKLNGQEITIEDSRGAGSLIATSRSARALTKMQKGEAARLGLEAGYKRLFRFGDGKNNLALPADDKTEWMELVSVALGNGEGEGIDAVMNGDSVGVVTKFKMPEASASVSSDEKSVALDLIKAGEWRKDVRSGDAWVGNPIAQAMQLDLAEETDKAHVKGVITAWIKEGVLKEVSRQDAKRMTKTFVEVAEQDKLSNDIFD